MLPAAAKGQWRAFGRGGSGANAEAGRGFLTLFIGIRMLPRACSHSL